MGLIFTVGNEAVAVAARAAAEELAGRFGQPTPVLSYYEARSATPENRDAAAAMRRRIEATVGLSAMRELTLSEVRDAVREYRAE